MIVNPPTSSNTSFVPEFSFSISWFLIHLKHLFTFYVYNFICCATQQSVYIFLHKPNKIFLCQALWNLYFHIEIQLVRKNIIKDFLMKTLQHVKKRAIILKWIFIIIINVTIIDFKDDLNQHLLNNHYFIFI